MVPRRGLQRRLAVSSSTLSVLALVTVGWFAFQVVAESRSDRAGAISAADTVELAVVAGDVIHELQLERGMSVGYVASDGRPLGPRSPGTTPALSPDSSTG